MLKLQFIIPIVTALLLPNQEILASDEATKGNNHFHADLVKDIDLANGDFVTSSLEDAHLSNDMVDQGTQEFAQYKSSLASQQKGIAKEERAGNAKSTKQTNDCACPSCQGVPACQPAPCLNCHNMAPECEVTQTPVGALPPYKPCNTCSAPPPPP
jgi:hypothetical protein